MQMCPACGQDNPDQATQCGFCRATLLHLLGRGVLLQARYLVERLLGCGGMGSVYLAQDTRLPGHRVAVKENLSPQSGSNAQFVREATTLAHLSHPHLPSVTDYFTEPGGRQYMIMEYIEGEDLATRLARGRQGEAEALAWFAQIAQALDYLHRQPSPIIHRDVKPGNIRITPAGRAYLVDFGLVEHLDPQRQPSQRLMGMGSAAYAPIEQYSKGTLDARTDEYALAATMYYALTGQEPPEAPARLSQMSSLRAPRDLNPSISPRVDAALTMALALRPADRFQNVAAFAAAMLGQPIAAAARASQGAPRSGQAQAGSGRKAAYAALGVAVGALAGVSPFFVAPHPGGAVGILLIVFAVMGTLLFASIGGLLGARLAGSVP